MSVQSTTDNRVRVYHTKPSVAKILLDTYHSLLLAVEDEWMLPKEFPKLDIVFVPTLAPKTLTKWGLVFVGDGMSPVEHSVVHSVALKDVQKEIALSVYQMFLCHLINPEWWTSQWITLGLARYFSGVTKHLPFDAEQEFVVDTVRMVIREHSPWTGWKLSQEYTTLQEINSPNMFAVDQRGDDGM